MEKQEYKRIPLGEVRIYEHDPYVFTDEELERPRRMLHEFKTMPPLLLDKDGVLLAGQEWAKAAMLEGWQDVPVIYDYTLADGYAQAYRLLLEEMRGDGHMDEGLRMDEINRLLGMQFDLAAYGVEIPELDFTVNNGEVQLDGPEVYTVKLSYDVDPYEVIKKGLAITELTPEEIFYDAVVKLTSIPSGEDE